MGFKPWTPKVISSNQALYYRPQDTHSRSHFEALLLGLYRINFFPIRPGPDFAGFGMTNPAGAGTGFSN